MDGSKPSDICQLDDDGDDRLHSLVLSDGGRVRVTSRDRDRVLRLPPEFQRAAAELLRLVDEAATDTTAARRLGVIGRAVTDKPSVNDRRLALLALLSEEPEFTHVVPVRLWSIDKAFRPPERIKAKGDGQTAYAAILKRLEAAWSKPRSRSQHQFAAELSVALGAFNDRNVEDARKQFERAKGEASRNAGKGRKRRD